MIGNYRIGKNTYYAVSDADIQIVTLTLFNKELQDEYRLDDYYQTVNDGKWTVEKFLEDARSVSEDVNGDGKFDMYDKTGYAGDYSNTLNAMPFACDMHLTNKTENGLELDFYSEKMVSLFEMMFDYFTDKTVCQGYTSGDGQEFSDGLSLFTFVSVRGIPKLRDCEHEFGIIPMPKYDEEQSSYRSYGWNTFESVMCTVTRPEFVGTVLEQWAYESKDTVSEAVIETLVKTKSSRDVESVEMLNIAYNTIVYDIAANYLGFDNNVSNLFYAFPRMIAKNDNAFTSMYEKYGPKSEKKLNDLYDMITERDAQ